MSWRLPQTSTVFFSFLIAFWFKMQQKAYCEHCRVPIDFAPSIQNANVCTGLTHVLLSAFSHLLLHLKYFSFMSLFLKKKVSCSRSAQTSVQSYLVFNGRIWWGFKTKWCCIYGRCIRFAQATVIGDKMHPLVDSLVNWETADDIHGAGLNTPLWFSCSGLTFNFWRGGFRDLNAMVIRLQREQPVALKWRAASRRHDVTRGTLHLKSKLNKRRSNWNSAP